jgi:hypothetical protein
MTPYHTPHTSQTPRYGQSTPQPGHGGFLHPGAPAPSNHRNYASSSSSHHHHQASPHSRAGGYVASQESMDWQKASDAWGSRSSNNRPSREGSRTPREQGRTTPKRYLYKFGNEAIVQKLILMLNFTVLVAVRLGMTKWLGKLHNMTIVHHRGQAIMVNHRAAMQHLVQMRHQCQAVTLHCMTKTEDDFE